MQPPAHRPTPPCSLLVILAKYGLDGRKDSRVVSSNFIDHGTDDNSLEDPRLEKLWHKVPSAKRDPRPGVLPGAAGLTLRALPLPCFPAVPSLPHLERLLLRPRARNACLQGRSWRVGT